MLQVNHGCNPSFQNAGAYAEGVCSERRERSEGGLEFKQFRSWASMTSRKDAALGMTTEHLAEMSNQRLQGKLWRDIPSNPRLWDRARESFVFVRVLYEFPLSAHSPTCQPLPIPDLRLLSKPIEYATYLNLDRISLFSFILDHLRTVTAITS